MRLSYLLLLFLVAGLAAYDVRRRRLPNRVTLPLLLAGLVLHFPGTPEAWLGGLLFFSAWRLGALGGGDAKLWIALLWLTPPALSGRGLFVTGLALTVSALMQVSSRALRKGRRTGIQTPGAWRALPYALWLLAVA